MKRIFYPFVCLLLIVYSCDDAPKSKKEVPRNWVTIFDGSTTGGWSEYNKSGLPDNWRIINSEFHAGEYGKGQLGKSIVYRRSFEYFELEFEWKLSEGGNSGVMYHVQQGIKYKHPFETGPEYQLLDDNAFVDIDSSLKTASDYAMSSADTNDVIRKAGEWNISKIVCTPSHVEHWLNGKMVLKFTPHSKEWQDKKSKSKWANYPDYGKAKKGLICLQDHGSPVAFRNIRVAELTY